MTRPTCVVTGACGFVGSHLLEALADGRHQIRATDLPSAVSAEDREASSFPSVARRLGLDLYPSDVRRPSTLDPLVRGADVVFHVAAAGPAAGSDDLRAINVEGTRAVCEAILRAGGRARLVVVSDGGVYGRPADGRAADEDAPLRPVGEYLRSKVAAESIVAEHARAQGLRHTILRPATIYGPRQVSHAGLWIRRLLRWRTVVWPRGLATMLSMVHVRDVAAAAVHLAFAAEAEGRVFNVSDETLVSTLEVLRLVVEVADGRLVLLPGSSAPLLAAGGRATDLLLDRLTGPLAAPLSSLATLVAGSRLDNRRLLGTGFRLLFPRTSEGLRETATWYLDNEWI